MTKLRSPSVVNVHDAKTHLSRLLERVSQGEEIVLAKAGKPCARLVPLESGRAKRTPGALNGLVVDESFFDALPGEELLAWEGRSDDEE